MQALLFSVVVLAAVVPTALPAQTDSMFAYGTNIGWINCDPLKDARLIVGDCTLAGYLYSANVGWIHLGNGAPAMNCRYANTSAADFGVNQDGFANLSGYAYGANIGWLNFGWAAANDPNRPRFSFVDGGFSGYAYGANIGWVKLGTGYLAISRIERPDTDFDGIADTWEMLWFNSLKSCDIGTDFDGDGQSDAAEAIADTDPSRADSFLKIVSQTYSNGQTSVALEFTTSAARLYRIEHSTDLKT